MLCYSDLEESLRERSFFDYLGTIDFKKYYDVHVKPKRGGGRDRISPRAYKPIFEKEIERIRTLCQSAQYQFSPYNEKLVLKGRNKFPRLISIPTVRDRFVLSVLNGYLRDKLAIRRKTANSYIKEAKEYIECRDNLYFFKTDIKLFFDSIIHEVLIDKLKDAVDSTCIQLVANAIKTPTCEPGYKIDKRNAIGVPQGISIASVLAEKYMEDFDLEVCALVDSNDGLYIRYVDDILILSPRKIEWLSILEEVIRKNNLGLVFTAEKTKAGLLSNDSIDYIGYNIKHKLIGVKAINQRLFSDRLAGRCHKFIKQLNNKSLRPRFITDDASFLEYSVMDINLLISGFRVGAHNHGWLPYFQQITDLTILYQLDSVVWRICGSTSIIHRLQSFVKTYHALRRNSGLPYVYNFDDATTIIQKTTILQKMGRISSSDHLSDAAIEYLFDCLIEDLTRDAKKDMKELS